MKNKKLIYDDGRIRRCSSNFYKLGFFWYLINECNYYEIIKNFAWREVVESLRVVCILFAWVMLFPVLPIIHAIHDWKIIVKENKSEVNK